MYPRQPKTIIRHVLPVLWYLLGNMSGSGVTAGGTGSIRGATSLLAATLYELMGDSLLQHASSLPPRHKNMLKELVDSNRWQIVDWFNRISVFVTYRVFKCSYEVALSPLSAANFWWLFAILWIAFGPHTHSCRHRMNRVMMRCCIMQQMCDWPPTEGAGRIMALVWCESQNAYEEKANI